MVPRQGKARGLRAPQGQKAMALLSGVRVNKHGTPRSYGCGSRLARVAHGTVACMYVRLFTPLFLSSFFLGGGSTGDRTFTRSGESLALSGITTAWYRCMGDLCRLSLGGSSEVGIECGICSRFGSGIVRVSLAGRCRLP